MASRFMCGLSAGWLIAAGLTSWPGAAASAEAERGQDPVLTLDNYQFGDDFDGGSIDVYGSDAPASVDVDFVIVDEVRHVVVRSLAPAEDVDPVPIQIRDNDGSTCTQPTAWEVRCPDARALSVVLRGGDDAVEIDEPPDFRERRGFVLLIGGEGADRLVARTQGRVSSYGSGGDDQVTISAKRAYILGEAGSDVVTSLGRGYLVGGAGDDQITGSPASDTIVAGPGDDHVDGLHGDDLLIGGKGADTIIGGQGADVLYGRGGIDQLAGHGGPDRIRARDGNAESVSCGLGRDVLWPDAADRSRSCEVMRRR